MSCNCRSFICIPAPAPCCTPTTESVAYTFENANASGLGFFDNETANLVQFRGLVSESDALIISLDAANKTIIIDFDGDLLIGDIPDASEAQRGMLEVATQAEANAGAVDNKIMTPLKVASMAASETQKGVLEIATQAEVTTGTNDTHAITALKLSTHLTGQKLTRTFTDAVARAAAVPNFDGQLGLQLDTNALVIANGTIAGSFTLNMVVGGTLTVAGALTQNGASDFNSSATFNGSVSLADASSVLFGSNEVDFAATTFAISGTPIGATDSILAQIGGVAAAKPFTEILSDLNPQTGWGTPSGTLARTTFATYAGQTISAAPTQAEVQALDNAVRDNSRRLGALVTDLLARLLPTTP